MASQPTRLRINPERMSNKCETTAKACFDSYAAALDQAESLMELGRVNRGCHITPYRCGDCGYWHVFNRRIVQVGTPSA